MGEARKIETVPVADYLAAERDSPVRHEYVDGILFAMTGARRSHNAVVAAFSRELGNHLLGGPCRIATSDMKVQVAPGRRYYYPDVVIGCNDPDDEPDEYTETRLVLIVEVLSPSTEATDRREKRVAYLAMESLIDYLLVDPDGRSVERYTRDGSDWSCTVTAHHETVELASIGLALAVSRLFA